MRKIFSLIIGLLLSSILVFAQEQGKAFLLMGGIAHLGNGEVINNSVIGIKDGKLSIVADATKVRLDTRGYEVVEIHGKHVYPGFILLNSPIGLAEVSAVRATRDFNEEGTLNPSVRSLTSYNTDSEIIPTLTFNGITTLECTPFGGVISGTSSVMNTVGWNWEDAVLKPDVAIHLNWPTAIKKEYDKEKNNYTVKPNETYDAEVNTLEIFFGAAKVYQDLSRREVNLKMEAMQGLFTGSQSLVVHVRGAKDVIDAVSFSKKHGVKRVVVQGDEVLYKVRQILIDNNIPVIIPEPHSLPNNDDANIDMPYKLAHLLTEAGVEVSITHSNMRTLSSERNLPFYAGTAVAYGMDKETALKTITLNPAKVLGIDDVVGSLLERKIANLIVSEGDAFDMRTNKMLYVFINGELVKLGGKQQELYKKYSDKYGHNVK